MEKNDSTLDAPGWINTDLVVKILSRDFKGNEIKSWKIEKATAPGDNYGSNIYRIDVDLQCDDQIETKSLIMKLELVYEPSELSTEDGIFERESHAYNIVIPQINKILQEAFGNKFETFTPKCYYTRLGPPGSVLVFEDLKKESFKLAERTFGLDMKHSLLVMRSLAKFHASSAVLFQKKPDLFEPLMSSVYRKSDKDLLETLFASVVRNLAEEVSKWPGYERFSDKLKKIADKAVDIIVDGVTRDEGDFNVLAHVDPWLNNIMFKYSEDTGEVIDLRLLDFQTCQWLSPAIDIQRYLFSTPTVEILEQQDFILEEYFKVLRETLDCLGYPDLCPTVDHLKKQMEGRVKFAIVLGFITRALFLSDPDDNPSFVQLMNNQTKIKFSKLFKEILKKMLPVLEKNNWI